MMRLLPPLSLLLLVAIMVAATSSSMGSSGASNAYYAITSPAMLAAPEWPAAYRNYSLFVVFDSISPANLTIMRRDIPHASFLIYHAYASVVTSGGRCSGCTGASCSRADRPPPAFFERQWAITDLRTKQPMCLGGWWPPTQRRNPQGYIPMRASADGMLRYIKQELWEGRGFDGVYFDNLFTSFPSEFRKLIANTTDQFDIDGDGQPDTFAELDAQWAAWRSYFTAGVRHMIGPDKLFIANTGLPHFADPALNGITIEFEWLRCGEGACGDLGPVPPLTDADADRQSPVKLHTAAARSALSGQQAATQAAGLQPLSLLWHTQSFFIPSEQQCSVFAELQHDFSWVLEGFDIEDHSWHGIDGQACARTTAK